jgi:hypothetical protein
MLRRVSSAREPTSAPGEAVWSTGWETRHGEHTRGLGFVAMAIVVVLGLVALFLFNGNITMGTSLDRDPKTWIVQPGETLRVRAGQVLPDDRWECPGRGGSEGTPPSGHGVGSSGGFSMEVDIEGNVTATCEPGPPGSV